MNDRFFPPKMGYDIIAYNTAKETPINIITNDLAVVIP